MNQALIASECQALTKALANGDWIATVKSCARLDAMDHENFPLLFSMSTEDALDSMWTDSRIGNPENCDDEDEKADQQAGNANMSSEYLMTTGLVAGRAASKFPGALAGMRLAIGRFAERFDFLNDLIAGHLNATEDMPAFQSDLDKGQSGFIGIIALSNGALQAGIPPEDVWPQNLGKIAKLFQNGEPYLSEPARGLFQGASDIVNALFNDEGYSHIACPLLMEDLAQAAELQAKPPQPTRKPRTKR